MSARKKFFYNGTLLTLVGLSIKTAALLFGAFVSRTVGAEGTGLYTIVMTVYSFAVTFATSGISLTVTRLVATAIGEGNRGELSRIMRGALLYSLAFSLIASSVLFFGAEFFGSRVLSDERAALSLKILSASLAPASLSSVFAGYFIGVKRVSANAAVQVITQLAKVVITAMLVIRMSEYGTAMAVAALCIGLTAAELVAFFMMLVQFSFDRLRDRKCKKRGVAISPILEMALPLAFSAYIRSGLLTLEHTLIPKSLKKSGDNSNEALSSYGTLHGMAIPAVLYPMSPLSSFSGLLVPEFAESMAEGNTSRLKRITEQVIRATLAYAAVVSVMLFLFSEEIGYVVYDSFDAGKYIALIAPVVPIMYLDHVTDSMLKGIGEHVYSMWVNITDSLLSVLLVCLLIPKMGIRGYAVVIIVMEAYNFALSFLRLKSKIKFSFYFLKGIILPLAAALLSAELTKALFVFCGSGASAYWLLMKIIFSACSCFIFYKILSLISFLPGALAHR